MATTTGARSRRAAIRAGSRQGRHAETEIGPRVELLDASDDERPHDVVASVASDADRPPHDRWVVLAVDQDERAHGMRALLSWTLSRRLLPRLVADRDAPLLNRKLAL